jgi:hypothetical protein
VEEMLLPRCENKIRSAIRALEYTILKFRHWPAPCTPHLGPITGFLRGKAGQDKTCPYPLLDFPA